MPGHDLIVVRFSALGVEALARLPNIHPRSADLPATHPVHEQPIELAAAERT